MDCNCWLYPLYSNDVNKNDVGGAKMKKIRTIFTAFLLSLLMVFSVSAEEHPVRLVDDADLLTVEDESKLLNELNEISERQQFDVVVVTTDSLGGKSPQAYADDFFDYNGYGMGEEYDGALLLVSMEYRDWYISTCGYGITALDDRALDQMADEFLPELSEGDYYEAFSEFALLCDNYVEQAKSGGAGSTAAGGLELFVCLLAGFLVAFIPMHSMKKQMKNVTMRAEASDYVKQGSRVITKSRDAFLYHTISRRPRPKENSTHTSSSGRSHGGGGGKF